MPSKQDLEPLLGTQADQLGLTFSASDGVDAKALAILGANIAVTIFIATLHLAFWQYAILYVSFLASLLLDVVSIWPRDYLGPAVDLDKSPEYLAMDRETLLLQLLADAQAAIRHNNDLNRVRLRFCFASIMLTALGFLLLLLILLI